ncbi:MAG TPA: FAD-binding oxidoreductase [Gemmatimonadales bacterium]|nr:FAD-binding oxidoreductase [Gemmatimonadales bacterium]
MLDRCLWTDTSPLPRFPALPLPRSTDVAVIGGGYTGLAAARALARRGVDVTLLERHNLGWGASSRNGGFVLPGFKPEMEELARMVGADRARKMFELSLEAMRYLELLIAEEEIACDFIRCGAVTLAAKPGHMKALEHSCRVLRDQLGYQTELIGRDDMAQVIGSARYHGALLDPGACSLQPAKFVQGVARAAERAGARLLEDTEVLRVEKTGRGFDVQTARGVVRAGAVFAATNGYTPRALAALRRRVVPIGSYLIATQPLGEQLVRRLVPGARVLGDTKHLLYYFRLSPDGRMVFGGRASFTPASPKRSAAILAAGMCEVFPELGGVTIEYAWSGKVAYPIDHLPHAGQLYGVHYSMGYCGHGVAMATYLGTRMGEVLAGAGTVPDLGGKRFKAIPLFNGFPWFLPFVGGYYRARDWLS